MKFESSIDGMIGQPFVHCSITSRNLRWRSVRSNAFRTVFQFNGDKFNIEKLRARISANLDTLADFFKVEGISGSMETTVRASGELSSLDVSASVSGTGINYKGYRADSVNADLNISGTDRIKWDKGYLRLEGTEVKTRGELCLSNMQTDLSLSIQKQDSRNKKRAGEISLTGLMGRDSVSSEFKILRMDISAISPWISSVSNFKGALDAQGDFKGTWKDLQGKVKARLDQPGYKVHRLASIDCILGLADSLLKVNSKIFLHYSSSLLRLNAYLPLLPSQGWAIDMSDTEKARMDLSGTGINLNDVAFIFDSSSVANGIGKVNLRMYSDQGSWVLGGTVQIADGVYRNRKKRITINKLKLIATLSGKASDPLVEYAVFCGPARFQRGRVDSLYLKGYSTIDTFNVTGSRFWFPNDGTVDASARVPLNNMDSLLIHPGFQVDFSIDRFPLVHVSPFLMENMIRSGVVNGKGKIRITGGRPILSEILNGRWQICL